MISSDAVEVSSWHQLTLAVAHFVQLLQMRMCRGKLCIADNGWWMRTTSNLSAPSRWRTPFCSYADIFWPNSWKKPGSSLILFGVVFLPQEGVNIPSSQGWSGFCYLVISRPLSNRSHLRLHVAHFPFFLCTKSETVMNLGHLVKGPYCWSSHLPSRSAHCYRGRQRLLFLIIACCQKPLVFEYFSSSTLAGWGVSWRSCGRKVTEKEARVPSTVTLSHMPCPLWALWYCTYTVWPVRGRGGCIDHFSWWDPSAPAGLPLHLASSSLHYTGATAAPA